MDGPLSIFVISRSDYVRNPRESFIPQDDDLIFSDDFLASATSNAKKSDSKKSSASEQVNEKLEFPGNEYVRPKRSQLAKGEQFEKCLAVLGLVFFNRYVTFAPRTTNLKKNNDFKM